ncbi:MAG: TadE/TadG family type IV pilus assembly protein [Chloroflexota bacterium]
MAAQSALRHTEEGSGATSRGILGASALTGRPVNLESKLASSIALVWRNVIKSRRGQSLVEFALILPVAIWVLLGVIDFGRLYFTYVTVTNASRVGAEFAMDPRRQASDVRAIVKQETSSLTIADSDILLTANPSWSAGSELRVSVRGRFEAVTPLISSLWGGGPLTLTGTTVTRFNTP